MLVARSPVGNAFSVLTTIGSTTPEDAGSLGVVEGFAGRAVLWAFAKLVVATTARAI